MFVDFRREVTNLIVGQDLLPVRGYLPDDVAELPSVVVGPVSISPGEVATTWDAELEVFLLGRRLGDDDSQAELDGYADKVLAIVLGYRKFPLTGAEPRIISVAGQDVPAVVFTLTSTQPGPC